ncbi:MAG TPA: hydantoinase/oxoprolinase family protein [Chloroflexota bacterium]|nr:hydantoinase/oxoprolinase family protein [Chloroflexota bacterium]
MRVGIDSGGTFTDCCTVDGRILKLPSDRMHPDEPVRRGLQALAKDADTLAHGTTVATNAVLERTGSFVALLTTAGFADVLEIRRQNRPKIYDLRGRWPPPLVPSDWRFGLRERLLWDGSVESPLDLEDTRRIVVEMRDAGVESVAICMLFSYLNPSHEIAVGHLVSEILGPNAPISLSCEVLPKVGEFERTSTTVLNAYIAPVMNAYLTELEREVAGKAGGRLLVMNSNGGLSATDLVRRLPVLTLLSGPAAGVIGAAHVGRSAGFDAFVTMDVGGTSTDVAVVPGKFLERDEGEIDGLALGLSMLDIETVGAGGGSIARIDAGGALHVGPASAGAVPGPACYGRGGPFTLTDANLILGRIPSELLNGDMPLDHRASCASARPLAQALGVSVEQLAWGVVRTANSNIERAIRRVSMERGYDPRGFALVAFGGAGPQMACEVAGELGISEVLVPPAPGVMAAQGLLVADERQDFTRALVGVAAHDHDALAGVFRGLIDEAARSGPQGPGESRLERRLDVRYEGQSFSLSLPHGPDLGSRFHEAHQARFGYRHEGRTVEVVAARLTVRTPSPDAVSLRPVTNAASGNGNRRPILFGGVDGNLGSFAAAIYTRHQCDNEASIEGPAVVEQYDSTIVIPPTWKASPLDTGALLLSRM